MLHQILTIAGLTLLVMLSPGPDMVLVTRNTLLGGRSAGLRTAAGFLAGQMVHVTYCVVGIGWLISHSVLAFSLLKYAAAAYLIYLGITSLRAASRSTPPLGRAERPSRSWFLQGFVANVLNPKATLFTAGLFTTLITPGTSARDTLVLVATMATVTAAFWLVFVFTLGSSPVRRALERGRMALDRIFGVLLIALGIRVALLDR